MMTHRVVQYLPNNMDARLSQLKQNAAFECWRKKLSPGDRLPRGHYFVGKKPGKKVIVLDEAWSFLKR
jgi:BarA-like signal transduction histidine kinase